MLSRKQSRKPKEIRDGAQFDLTDLRPEVRAARVELAAKGWSYRSAAKEIGVHHMHLTHVLTGRRYSRSLCERIIQLPQREVVA
jgi:hypothetical protein